MKEKENFPDKTGRVYELIDHYSKGNVADFARMINVGHQVLNRIFNLDRRGGKAKYPDVSPIITDAIIENIPEVSIEWLHTGKGKRFKGGSDDGNAREDESGLQIYDSDNKPSDRRVIPLYDDVSTIGGRLNGGYTARMQPDAAASEWIDPGGWFKYATHAIRHYEDSMIEYPSGCILALREIQNHQLIVPGKNYVIETDEYRVTKKVQFAKEEGYIRLHSTNDEKYEDGTLIHHPFNLHLKDEVRKIYEVLGHVVKTGIGTMVSTNKNVK